MKKQPDLLSIAFELHRSGKIREAIERYSKLLTQQKNNAQILYLLGTAEVQTGQIQEGIQHIQRSLAINPRNQDALNILGNAFNKLHRFDKALACYQKVLLIRPDNVEAYINVGNALNDLQRLKEAETSYREAIRIKPDYAIAHRNLGDVLNDLGRLTEAEASYREAIRLKPDYAIAHSNLGHVLNDLGRLKEAEASYREAIRLKPDYAIAHRNLANVLNDLGRLKEAEASCREAIRLKPDYAIAHNNLANVLNDLGRLKEAEASYREAIRIKPDYAIAHSNLGNVLRDLGQLMEAEASCRKAIRLKPDYAIAHSNLANVLSDLGRLTEAEASCREAIFLKPNFAEAHINLGNVLRDLRRLEEAEASFREAIRLKPDFAEAHSNLGNVLRDLGRLTEAEDSLREAIRLKPDYAIAHSILLFNLNYIESLSPEAALFDAKQYGSMVSVNAEPKFTSWPVDFSSTKLRIGFVSGDFRSHPVGFFLEGLIRHLDKSQFEIYAFPTIPNTDDLTNRIKPHFHKWVPIYGESDHESAMAIHKLGIHVLVDLSGHSAHNRLKVFSYKPAPVQVSWLGYFATTGLPEMDYFLGDPHMLPPNEEHHFTEMIWKLADTWLCLTPPEEPVLINPLPALANGYMTFGCFGNLSKMNDKVVKRWAMILQRVPDSRLFLKSKQLGDASVIANVRSLFAEYGISIDRLILEGLSSRKTYFESYNRIDMVLDTFPYPGGTTSVDALWMGVPVLTLRGNRFLSHLGESIAINAGQSNWIAQDQDDYVNKAVAFASDLHGLATTRKTLRNQVLQTPLFDNKRFARNFGDALVGMLKRKQESCQPS